MNKNLQQIKDLFAKQRKTFLITILSVLGIVAAVILIQSQQIFKSKAFDSQDFIEVESQDGPLAYNSTKEGYITNTNSVTIKLKNAPSEEVTSKFALQSTQTVPAQPQQTINTPIQSLFGVSTHAWWIDLDPNAYIDQFNNLSVKELRIAVDWKRFEAVEGKYDFSLYDRTLNRLNNAGFKITGIFVTIPPWVSSNPPGCAQDETTYCDLPSNQEDKFRKAARAAIHRYPFITNWEVGNEPELWKHLGDNLSDYIRILRIFYQEAKAFNPNIKVGAATIRGWNSYIAGLYDLAPEKPFDAITFHPYASYDRDGKINPQDVAQDDKGSGLRTKEIDNIRAGMVAKGDGNKPIWITEYGWDKPPAEQAQKLKAFMDWVSVRPWITLAHIHMLHDIYDSHYGLTSLQPSTGDVTAQTSFIPKQPFYDTFKNYPRTIQIPAKNF